jgi:cell division protein FtsB
VRTGPAWLRWAVLGTIMLVLAVTLVPTVGSFLRQRAEIAALQDKVTTQRQTVTALEAEKARWSDPAYVEQQARERLKFVKVGDRSYSVIDPEQAAPTVPAGASVAAPTAHSDAPWYGLLWQSVQLADQPAAGLVPATGG